MCVQDIEKVDEAMEPTMGLTEQQEQKVWPLPSSEFLNTQIDNFDTKTLSPQTNSSPLESINENKVVMDNKQNQLANFILEIRSGEWAHIGSRDYMEDTHVCIADMAKKFGQEFLDREAVSFFGMQLAPEVQSALLQQVMSLTSEQLSSLPPEQQQQVLQLQQMLR